jgi:hypothetical protein
MVLQQWHDDSATMWWLGPPTSSQVRPPTSFPHSKASDCHRLTTALLRSYVHPADATRRTATPGDKPVIVQPLASHESVRENALTRHVQTNYTFDQLYLSTMVE